MPHDAAARFEPGYRFGRDHQFTADEVRQFAVLAGDTNPLHHDAAWAERSRFGGLITSGTHTTALLLGQTANHFSEFGTVVGLGFSVSFLRPVAADARVRIEWEVTGTRDSRTGRGQVLDLQGSIKDVQGRVCVSASGRVLVGGHP